MHVGAVAGAQGEGMGAESLSVPQPDSVKSVRKGELLPLLTSGHTQSWWSEMIEGSHTLAPTTRPFTT